VQLQQIRDRDAEFDQELDEIGEGIQDLHELALRQGEEVQRQNAMLQQTQSRIDSAHEHMTNVNAKMKDTLNEVGRSSDKLCVDIMCIVSAITDMLNYCIFGSYDMCLSSLMVRSLSAAFGSRICWYILQNVEGGVLMSAVSVTQINWRSYMLDCQFLVCIRCFCGDQVAAHS